MQDIMTHFREESFDGFSESDTNHPYRENHDKSNSRQKPRSKTKN